MLVKGTTKIVVYTDSEGHPTTLSCQHGNDVRWFIKSRHYSMVADTTATSNDTLCGFFCLEYSAKKTEKDTNYIEGGRKFTPKSVVVKANNTFHVLRVSSRFPWFHGALILLT